MGCLDAFSFKRNGKSLFTPPGATQHVRLLDGLRALGAVWVVAFHTFQLMPSLLAIPAEGGKQRYDDMANSFFMRVVNNGELGVDIFFILSGFLIMSILRRDLAPLVKRHTFTNAEASETTVHKSVEKKSSLGRAIARFFIRRYFRIMPVYALALILGVAIKEFGTLCRNNVWRNLLFIQNFFPTADMCLTWSWSIAVEWQMYIVSPLVVWAVLRWPHRSRLLLSALCFISLTLYISLTAYDVVAEPAYFNEVWLIFLPYTRVFAYFAGMLVALEVQPLSHKSSAAETESVVVPLTIKAIILRCGAILIVLLSALCTSSSTNQNYGWHLTQMLFTRPVFVFGMVYVMYDALVPRGPDRYQEIVNSILGSRPLYVLAQVSYGLYLFHVFGQGLYLIFNGPLASGSIEFRPEWIYPVVLILILILISALSSLIFLLIEKPAINFVANILRDPPAPVCSSPV